MVAFKNAMLHIDDPTPWELLSHVEQIATAAAAGIPSPLHFPFCPSSHTELIHTYYWFSHICMCNCDLRSENKTLIEAMRGEVNWTQFGTGRS